MKTKNRKKIKNSPKLLIIISILVVLLGLLFFFLNKRNKDNLSTTNTNIKPKITGAWVLSEDDKKYNECPHNNGWFNSSKKYDPKKELFEVQDLGFLFPEGTTPIMSNSSIITMNNKLYKIDIEKLGGLCSPNVECTYNDEENITNIRTLRIWENNGKVFAINPQDINLNGSFIGNIVIEKLSSDILSTNFQYFTTEEVQTWKNILSNPVFLED